MNRPIRVLFISIAAAAIAAFATACGTQKISVPQSDPTHRGAVLFSQRCSGCHTLSYAATNGSATNVRTATMTNGPNFNVRCERPVTRVLYAIENGGFSGAVMPQNIVVGHDAAEVAQFVAKYAGRQAPKLIGVAPCTSQAVGTLARAGPDRHHGRKHRGTGDRWRSASGRPQSKAKTQAKKASQGQDHQAQDGAPLAPRGRPRSRSQTDPQRPGRRARGAGPPRTRAAAKRWTRCWLWTSAGGRSQPSWSRSGPSRTGPAEAARVRRRPRNGEQLADLAARGRALERRGDRGPGAARRGAGGAAQPARTRRARSGRGTARGRGGRGHGAGSPRAGGMADRHGTRARGYPDRASPTSGESWCCWSSRSSATPSRR